MNLRMNKLPCASSPLISQCMKKVRVRDNKEEIAVRRFLFANGYHFRVQYKPKDPTIGRSSIDIAFPQKKIAIFIDGCFWHGCDQHGQIPKTNNKWWRNKFAENRASDEKVNKILSEAGWLVRRFWSHQIPEIIASKIIELLNSKSCDRKTQKRKNV
jgi:DNA mismatch endonuclease, patch repair protein